MLWHLLALKWGSVLKKFSLSDFCYHPGQAPQLQVGWGTWLLSPQSHSIASLQNHKTEKSHTLMQLWSNYCWSCYCCCIFKPCEFVLGKRYIIKTFPRQCERKMLIRNIFLWHFSMWKKNVLRNIETVVMKFSWNANFIKVVQIRIAV